jgi:hypothetical protein
MHKMPATSWARINPRLSSSRRRSTKASTGGLTVLKPLFCLAAVVLPMVTLTTAALAGEDDKTYPGAMCRVITPTAEVADLGKNAVGLGANGAMLNFSLVDQTWICPAVRDHMDTDPEFARITVQENGTDPVSCEFEARDVKGQNPVGGGVPSKVKTEVLTSSPLTLAVQYTWGGGEIDALANVPDHGYYFLRCLVPGRGGPTGGALKGLSGVITYKVSEN